MIKYGAHCYLFTERWSDDQLDLLDTVKELGLHCFEISVGDDIHFTADRTRHRSEALGLELIIGPGGLWPAACDVSADDPEERRQGLAWHKKQLDLASDIGAIAYCGALYGHPGVVKRRKPPADEYKRTAASLHELAEYARKRGVLIGLEPMSHFRTHVVNTPEQVMRLIEMAEHANLYVVLDTYHMITEVRDYARAIAAAGDKLWAIHACDNDRGLPGGGLVPWDTVFSTLKELSFDGHIMMESYNSAIGNLAYERGMFHDPCPDGREFVRQGLTFLKQGLAGCGGETPEKTE